ncbi:transposase, partial [Salinibacter ruber]|nr:transposase [Salinibacter ruber]
MTHEIKRTYRYRIYPNEAQRAELARTFGCSRWV